MKDTTKWLDNKCITHTVRFHFLCYQSLLCKNVCVGNLSIVWLDQQPSVVGLIADDAIDFVHNLCAKGRVLPINPNSSSAL